jgi:hypothetical protein
MTQMALRALIVFDALSLLLMAGLHVGLELPLGVVTLADVRIVDATIVEGVAGGLFVVAAVGVVGRRRWAWTATLVAHLFTLAGVLVGIFAIEAGKGPHSPLNDGYHRLMVGLLLVGLVLLFAPSGRAALAERG